MSQPQPFLKNDPDFGDGENDKDLELLFADETVIAAIWNVSKRMKTIGARASFNHVFA